MNLTTLTHRDALCLNARFTSREEAIHALTQRLAALGKISSTEQFLEEVYRRESLGPTALGEGLAVPHGKTAAVESDPKLRALRPHLKIDLVQEGLRIQIIDSQNRPMFRTGSADVEPYMRDILRAIAPVLNGIPNRISLSGHTDDFPYASGEKGYSNWELSADRANASRRELMVGGLDSGKVLRVVGMAATMRLSDRGPDDAVNRRISLLVLNKQAEQAILHENAESQNEPVSALEKPEVAPQVSVPTMPSAEPR